MAIQTKLLASSPNEAGIIQMMNRYWYSTHYIVKDGKPFNTETGKTMERHRIIQKNGRFRFELILDPQ